MQFIDDRNQKLIKDIRELIYSEPVFQADYKMLKSTKKWNDIIQEDIETWEDFSVTDIWGGDNESVWFAVDIIIPPHFNRQCVVYELKTGREGLWDATNPQFSVFLNGKRKQGLDVNHREVILSEKAHAGEVYHLILSAFSGNQNFHLKLESEIKILHREIEEYYYDIAVPAGVYELLEKDSSEAIKISKELTESLNFLDLRKPYSDDFYRSLEIARVKFKTGFYERYCGQSSEVIYTVGHTHIDVAWLWTLSVTRDKVVRSFSSALELMRQYPKFKFMSSQPQLYQFVKEEAPEIFEDIRKRILEGRWEAEGGMFLEADCNLSSGESLIRQFVFGKRFFQKEFGVDNEILWLPDVFGYSAALPQIMKKCGIKYFMTTKISWNETNKMPYDTFMWEGIDGTEILTHFISTRDYNAGLMVEGKKRPPHFTTYNGILNPSQVKGTWQRYSQKYLNHTALMCFGFGDGGGGPTREMLENERRLATGIPGCPRTKMSSAREFFDHLEEEVAGKKELPKWVGELYLEYHRGTYTSMARNKRYNRRAEFLLQDLEALYVLTKALGVKEESDGGELANLWEILLRNQFHDILPGSSCREVYEDSQKEYEGLFGRGNHLREHMLDLLIHRISGEKGNVIVFNMNAFESSDVVKCPYPGEMKYPVVISEGKPCYLQKISDTEGIFTACAVPSKGWKVFKIEESSTPADIRLHFKDHVVETPYLRAVLNDQGQFESIFDKKEERELIKENSAGNVMVTYEDRPHNYDAWDINNYYTQKEYKVEGKARISMVENGPVRMVIEVLHEYLDSVIEQNIIFYAACPRIDLVNKVTWKEKNILLRCYFPFSIHASEATYEIQYGNVKRPAHYNTSWDQAKFEVCAHKWIDISEDGYGVSVINDCKYGCDIHDGTVGLTMLKSAVYPNPDADQEYHEFSYSIYPHTGSWKEGETIQKAYEFNNPMMAKVKEERLEGKNFEHSFVKTDNKNVVIEVLKPADDGEGIVLRLYEAFNRTCEAALEFSYPIVEAYECDMLEQKEKKLVISKNVLLAAMKPYEIKTIKMKLKY